MYKSFSMDLAGRTLTVDVGRVGKQANGCAFMHYGETTVLLNRKCHRPSNASIVSKGLQKRRYFEQYGNERRYKLSSGISCNAWSCNFHLYFRYSV